MRFSPPWSPDPDRWHANGGAASTPGLDPACARPVASRLPVVHRFHDLFLLPRGPFELPPPLPPSTHRTIPGDDGVAAPPPPWVGTAGTPATRPWAESRLRWGVFAAYEQAWHWQGASLGELIESISLTPLEKLEIQVYTWDRSKSSRDFESTDLVDQKSETSLTMHASAQVVRRMEKETHWNLGVNVGFSSGVTAGLEVGVGGSSGNLMERRREQTQDVTSRTARQVRAERRVAISTVRESGIEQRRTRTLRNESPTRTVTFNFYETLSHYRVEIAPVEATWVVAIPNALPAITPEWVACHEGILRERLLDGTQVLAFDAVRRLARRYPTDLVQDAVRRLHSAFVAQPMSIPSPPHPWRTGPVRPEPQPIAQREPDERPSPMEAFVRTFAAILTAGLSELVHDAVTASAAAEGEADRQSYSFIESYLRGVIATPSVPGLVAAMKLVSDWYLPFTRGSSTFFYRLSSDAEAALGNAYAVLVQATGEYPPSLEMPEGATEETQTAVREAWHNWKRERDANIAQAVADHGAYETLRCHIGEHLLHYMRAIWLSEDPGQRLARLSRELLAGVGDAPIVAHLVEQPLLGFHLNCSVFPVRLGAQLDEALRHAVSEHAVRADLPGAEGPALFATSLATQAGEQRARVAKRFHALAERRFREDSQRLLDAAVRDAVRVAVTCNPKRTGRDTAPTGGSTRALSLDPAQLPDVLNVARDRVVAALAAAREPGAYLGDDEARAQRDVDAHLAQLAATQVDTAASAENVRQVVDGGRLADRVVREGDLKAIIVTLPDGGYYCEPVLGSCPAVDDVRARELEAHVAQAEAVARDARVQADRHERRIAAGNLDADPPSPTVHVITERAP